MSAAHTPGPWHVSDRVGAAIGISSPTCVLAFVEIPGDVSGEPVEGESLLDMRVRTQHQRLALGREQIANAHLMKAAPDLLEALQDAIECGMVPISTCAEGGAAKFSRQVVVADKIRSAIAKATKETP